MPLKPATSTPRIVSSDNRDKPLPSPPVAQLVNLSSPAKANRTLVDATVSGTPPGEVWPVLKPESVPSAPCRRESRENKSTIPKPNPNAKSKIHPWTPDRVEYVAFSPVCLVFVSLDISIMSHCG